MEKIVEKNNIENKVEIVLSNTYLSSFYGVLDRVKKLSIDKYSNIILVVPDKFSLNAEKILFDKLKVDSIFNVWITTLSRLISKVLEDEKNLKLLSKNSGTMLVSEIIQKNVEKISTYKKITNNYAFAETMFNVINLLKSSGVKPDELKQNFSDTNFGLKVRDIYTIYSEYENRLKDNIDSITRLEIFDKKLIQSEYIRNSHICFAMFDSFTNAQLSSLSKLAKTAKSFCIGLCANTLQNNSYIYDNVTFKRLTNRFQDDFVKYNISNITSNFTQRQNFIIKNLFAIEKPNAMETDDVKLVECDKIQNEIFYVASKIKYLILEKGFKFDDINIAVCGLKDYQIAIKNIFEDFNLPYYIDESRTLLECYFASTLLNIFSFISKKCLSSDAVAIAKSPLFCLEKQKIDVFENYCYKYNFSGDEFYKNIDFEKTEQSQIAENVRQNVFGSILNLKQNFEGKSTIHQYIEVVRNFMQQINAEKVLQDNAERLSDIVEQKVELQVYHKFDDLLCETDNLLGNETMKIDIFFEMLKSGMGTINVLTIPIKCDSIFVGDSSISTYYPRKVLFVMGATSSRMPSYQMDFGTITDSEIKDFKSREQITPSIKELNTREKFKLFNLVVSSSDKLELTYSTLINGTLQEKSEFIKEMQQLFCCNAKPLNVEKYSLEEVKLFGTEKQNLLAYFVGTELNAIKIAKENSTPLQNFLHNDLFKLMKREEKKYLEDINKFTIKNARQILFPAERTKVSQIERYFDCPFKQFVDYGVRVKENEKFEIKSLDVGNILHKTAQYYVNFCIENKFENVDEKFIKLAFSKSINEVDNKFLSSNKYALKNLENEAIRFCNAIKHQIESSDFKPFATEYKFDNIKLESGLTIKGFVDRLDIASDINAFRVIDYKTGSQEFNFESAYYGIKLQLFVYLKILQDILKKQGVSTTYMPVKNTFQKFKQNEFELYKLNGVLLDDAAIFPRFDKALLTTNKSDIIDIKYNKELSISESKQKNLLTKQQFDDIENYCLKILNCAIDEMLDGYITPKPFYINDTKYSCKYCQYSAICHYKIFEQGYREIKEKTKSSFCEEKDVE